jgi:hypothetical protein
MRAIIEHWRFWSKVDISGGPDACWPWKGGMDKGYGRFKVRGRKMLAHRYSLELHLGRPIQDGLLACHRCNYGACVNPAHLYEGTQRDNMQDAIGAGTFQVYRGGSQPGEKAPHTTLLEHEALDIYQRACAGENYRSIASEYGISRDTVKDIKNGRSWASITGARRKR